MATMDAGTTALWMENGAEVTVTGGSAGDELSFMSGSPDGTVSGDSSATLTVTGEATVVAKNTGNAEPVQDVTVVGEKQTTTSGSIKTTTITASAPADPPAQQNLPAQPDIPTVNELMAMGEDAIKALTPAQMSALTQELIEALTADQIGWLSPTQIQALTTMQIRWLLPAQIGSLSETQIGYLTLDQIEALTFVQKANLSEAQLLALETRHSQLTNTVSASLKVLCGDPVCRTVGCTGPDDYEHGKLQTSGSNKSLSLSDKGIKVPLNIPLKPGMTINDILWLADQGPKGNVLIGTGDLMAALNGEALLKAAPTLNKDDLLVTNNQLHINQAALDNIFDTDTLRRVANFGAEDWLRGFDVIDPAVSSALEGQEFVEFDSIEGDFLKESRDRLKESMDKLNRPEIIIGQDFEIAVDGKPVGTAQVDDVWPEYSLYQPPKPPKPLRLIGDFVPDY